MQQCLVHLEEVEEEIVGGLGEDEVELQEAAEVDQEVCEMINSIQRILGGKSRNDSFS